MGDATMTIGGRPVAAEETFDVIDPATGEVFARAPECSTAQLDAAFETAQEAYRTWRLDEPARRQALVEVADALEQRADELAGTLTREQGKPRAEAALEYTRAAMWYRYYAELDVSPEVIQDDDRARVEVVRKPLGVVAAITPWNFPVQLAAWKLAPALLAGNTVVLKPSPYTPLSSLQLGEILGGILPPGVVNVVSGSDPLGAWMTAHPIPRKITFTGSITSGKHVAVAAAEDLKRVTLELGGNDPAILLNDVDPDAIADDLFWGGFANNGQVCTAVKRVYVPEALVGPVVDALADRARTVRVGPGSEEGTRLGPLCNRAQLARVGDLVDDALTRGARAAHGGHAIGGGGYFFEPTILADVQDGMRIVDEEQFGPVMPIISYRHLDEAVERANATHFGLSGSVWSADLDRAVAVADRLECGTAWINTHKILAPHQPFGGAKWSGLGVENGPWGYHAFTEMQVQYLRRPGPAG